MLVVETIGRIRREHFVRGKSIKEIVRELKVSRKHGTQGAAIGSNLFRIRSSARIMRTIYEQSRTRVEMLYEARLQDLRPNDFLKVEIGRAHV